MASQIDKTRVYSSLTEATDSRKTRCPLCRVYAVPRGISESGTNDLGAIKTHCPNCGNVYGTHLASQVNPPAEVEEAEPEAPTEPETADPGTTEPTA